MICTPTVHALVYALVHVIALVHATVREGADTARLDVAVTLALRATCCPFTAVTALEQTTEEVIDTTMPEVTLLETTLLAEMAEDSATDCEFEMVTADVAAMLPVSCTRCVFEVATAEVASASAVNATVCALLVDTAEDATIAQVRVTCAELGGMAAGKRVVPPLRQ